MNTIDLCIDNLLLDEDNPRIGSVDSQTAALEAIINLSESHFRNLMLSIKKHGLDPGDSLYVLPASHEEDFIVLEGNRRLSALMVLNNPDLLISTGLNEKTISSLKRLADGFDRTKVEPIRCVQFDQREDANEWISRRHTGTSDGEGRIQWGPLEIQRFSGDHSLVDIIDFIGRNGNYSPEEWESTRSVIESRKSSNLSRLLESRRGREHLGISIINKGGEKLPALSSDPKWALKVLNHIIDDLKHGIIDSRQLNKASDIDNYFSDLPTELQPQSITNKSLVLFRDIGKTATDSEAEKRRAKPKKDKKSSNPPKKRKTLAPKRHPFKIPESTKGQTLVREASTIDVDKYTLSASYLMRAFIELALNDYIEKNGIASEIDPNGTLYQDMTLRKKVASIVPRLIKNHQEMASDLRTFQTFFTAKDSPGSVRSFNAFIHSKHENPVPDAVRAAWDLTIPLLIAIYGKAE